MPTRVFISWSGELSHKLAEELRDWLPSALQFVKPYFSPKDIEKGSKWNSEISNELELSDIGILCLTRNNTEEPWILFEAGALSKKVDASRVCPLLFDLEPADVKGPLATFQSTKFVKDDFHKLIIMINSSAPEDVRLETATLNNVFETWWPKLEEKIASTLSSHTKSPKKEIRKDRDIIEEILEIVRMGSIRPSRIAPTAIMDLVESLDELAHILARENSGVADRRSLRVFERIDRPIRHLCIDAGYPEIYEEFRHRFRRIYSPEFRARKRVVPTASIDLDKMME